jgi:putative copper export protein
MTKDIVEVKSRIKYVLLEILVWLVPVLIYFYIKPDLNKPLTFKTNYIQYLLIISTVLLGFVITALGIRYRIPQKISQDLVERKTLDLMQAFLPMSAIIGFVEIILILRWLAVPDDFFLGIIILLFSFQIMFTLTASFPYLFFIFPQKPKK